MTPNGENEFFLHCGKYPPWSNVADLLLFSATKGMRRMHVWTPPGYNIKDEKLPVFYLIHGGG